MRSRTAVTLRRLAVVAVVAGACLLIPEALIRLRIWPVPDAVVSTAQFQGPTLVEPHPRLRYALRPNTSVRRSCSDYNLYEVSTGSLGSPEIGFRVGGSAERIGAVMIGDSFVMSVGVDEPQTLPSQVAKSLGTGVLNLGLAGYGPQQARIALEDYGLESAPELVVWVFFGNDIVDSVHFEDWVERGSEAGPAAGSGPGLHKKYWATYKLWRYYAPFHSSRREHWSADEGPEYVFTYDLQSELDLDSDAVRRGLHLMDDALRAFSELAGTHDFQPLLVLMPFKEQVYEAEFRSVARRDITSLDIQSAYSQVALAAAEHGIPTLDLTPALRESRESQIYFKVDPHLTPIGNRVASRAISSFVQSTFGL